MADKNRRSKSPRPEQPPAPPPDDPGSPGWDAITAAVDRLYPDQPEPLHVAAVPHPPLGGDGLIYGISIYRAESPRHWHFVTYGFSELYDKRTDDPAVSGWGFELTFRLTRGDEDHPPNWALNFLNNLSRYVRRSGNGFADGHYMDLNGPIALGVDTAVRAIAFVPDPQLGRIDTPNGRVEFLQVVGLTADELHACGDWTTSGVVDILRGPDPLLVTDLGRGSVLADPAVAARVQAGIDRDGSSAGGTNVSVVDWSHRKRSGAATVTLGAKGVEELLRKLRSRLLHGRDFWLIGPDKAVVFRPAGANGFDAEGDRLAVDVTGPTVRAMLATLKPVRGSYRWEEFPGLTLEVRPSQITDADGNVTEVIG